MAGRLYEEARFRVNGDRSLLVEYGDGIDLDVNEKVRAMWELLRLHPPPGVEHVIPAYRSLALIYDPLATNPSELKERVSALEQELSGTVIPLARTVEIPVLYGGESGPDMEFVAETNGLTVEQVIAIHTSTFYHIFAVGFAPGFCYLGGLDSRLSAPRLETPRVRVPAGSVGIAESQTGVYPLESPGGWRLIGRTPLRLFNPEKASPFLYQPGDRIKFTPISRSRFKQLQARVKAG